MITLWFTLSAYAVSPCDVTVPAEPGGDLGAEISNATAGETLCLVGSSYTLNSKAQPSSDITIQPLLPTDRPLISKTHSDVMFEVQGATVTFQRLTLNGGFDGRLVLSTGAGAHAVLDDVHVRNGVDDQGGCLRADDGAAMTLRGGEVRGCQSTNGRGGGLYIDDAPTLVDGTLFIGNTVDTDRGGAAVYVEDGTGSSIVGATFRQNTAASGSRGGGGIYVQDAKGLTVSDSVFDANRAEGSRGGAAVYIENPKELLLQRVTFTDNDHVGGAGEGGGAIYLRKADTPQARIVDSLFCRNRTTGGGGAIYSHETDVSIEFSMFWNNEADGSGGAIFINDAGGDDVFLTNGSFANNLAKSNSGHAVYSNRDVLVLTHSWFGFHGQADEAVHANGPNDIDGSYNAYESNFVDTSGNFNDANVVALGVGSGLAPPKTCSTEAFIPPAGSPLADGGMGGALVGAQAPRVDTGATADTGTTGTTGTTADTSSTANTGATADTSSTASTGATADTSSTASTGATADTSSTASTGATADTSSTADTGATTGGGTPTADTAPPTTSTADTSGPVDTGGGPGGTGTIDTSATDTSGGPGGTGTGGGPGGTGGTDTSGGGTGTGGGPDTGGGPGGTASTTDTGGTASTTDTGGTTSTTDTAGGPGGTASTTDAEPTDATTPPLTPSTASGSKAASGCSCATPASAPWWGVLLAPLVLVRRRPGQR